MVILNWRFLTWRKILHPHLAWWSHRSKWNRRVTRWRWRNVCMTVGKCRVSVGSSLIQGSGSCSLWILVGFCHAFIAHCRYCSFNSPWNTFARQGILFHDKVTLLKAARERIRLFDRRMLVFLSNVKAYTCSKMMYFAVSSTSSLVLIIFFPESFV